MENKGSLDDHIYFEDSWNDEVKQTKSELANNFLAPYDDIKERKVKKDENIDNYYNGD